MVQHDAHVAAWRTHIDRVVNAFMYAMERQTELPDFWKR